jgi:tetratricopeptide (TPR) repeat protein
MSWLDWCVLAGGIYLAVVVVRGIVHFTGWVRDEFFPTREQGRQREQRRSRPARIANDARREKPIVPSGNSRLWAALAHISFAHWLAAVLDFFRMLASAKRFDYWVGLALAEENPSKQAKYLTKALALNPTYAPAWGLKAEALLTLARYEEALACFDKVLEMAPDGITWYHKGLCLLRLRRCEQAVACFNKALNVGRLDRELRDEILRHKQLAAAEAS